MRTLRLDGGDDVHFHQDVRLGQLGFDGGATRGGALGGPFVPGAIHALEVQGDVAQEDGHHQDVLLVAAGLGEEFVDVGQGLAGLLVDVAGKVVGQLAAR